MISYNRHNSPLMQKSQNFSVRISKMVEFIEEKRLRNSNIKSVLNQIMRSGTSVMANIGESQFAQSNADFITKLHIALKEASETERWLNFLYSNEYLMQNEYESMNKDCSEIIAMLVASVKTSKRNQSIIIK
ncbi:MAG: four helix bundle protein [Prevotella sp.]|nr:four helix bundle protein [Prevotella sp.]